MKRNLRRTIGLVLVLMGLCHNFCYADVIAPSPVVMFLPFAWLGVVVIGLIVLIISIISFFVLKSTAKKNVNVDVEKNEKKIKKSGRRIYVWGMILATMVNLFFMLYFTYSHYYRWIFWITIIMFIISAVIRKKTRKVSNIICIISICIIFIMPIGYSVKRKIVGNYNDKFSEYRDENYNSVTELIKKVIENNEKNKNQITIEYNNREYKTLTELNNLINILNKKGTYFIKNNQEALKRLTKIEIIWIEENYSYKRNVK